MSSEPTLRDALRLIGEIPDSVHPDVISVLVWLQFDPASSNDVLESRSHLSRSARARALKWLKQTQAVAFEFVYKNGDSLVTSFEPPSSDTAPAGRLIRREAKINWLVLNHIDEVRGLALDPLTDEKSLDLEGPGGTPLGGPGGTLGREGTAETGLIAKPRSTLVDPGRLIVTRLVWPALNELCLVAQRSRGEKHPVDIVRRGDDRKTLLRLLNKIPARDRWVPWERIVNLFSLWVERHPRRKLKFEIRAFVEQHDQWLTALAAWENESTEQLRRLPAPEVDVDVEERVADEDPRIGEIGSFTYELTGVLPAVVHVKKLLAVYELEEITGAITEYTGLLSDKELKWGMKSFFAEGGAVAVITARRKREKK